ncbi:MAG: transposase [Cyanobacteria bacterium P01_A01_bin.68]
MVRILGLDVSKSSVSACLLESKPEEPRQFYYKYDFKYFKADASGIKGVLNLNPDVVVIEPTGTNYSKLWITVLSQNGVIIRLVGHKELRRYRSSHLQLPDKDDNADALALACYAFDYTVQSRYLQIRDATTSRIKELVLRLMHLNRVQSPIINRLRQDLSWQFPEIALVHSVRGSKGEVPLLWGWLCGQRKSKRYDTLYLESVGLGLTESARLHARRLCDLQREEYSIECEIESLLSRPDYVSYRKVFKNFGFGLRVEAMIISQIYPLTNFLDDNKKPIVEFYASKSSGKMTKRRLSERRFQKVLGLAPTQESSGDKKKSKVAGGSALCRKALWQWVFTRVEVKKNRNSQIAIYLGQILDQEKRGGRPVRLVRSRIAVRAVKLLFNQLVKQLSIN